MNHEIDSTAESDALEFDGDANVKFRAGQLFIYLFSVWGGIYSIVLRLNDDFVSM